MGIEQTPITRLMTSGVRTATPETSAREAATKLVEADISSLVVVDPDTDRVEGMITSSDLVEIISAGEDSKRTPIRKYMREPAITVGPEHTLRDAAVKMMRNDIHHLPVYDDGHVVGMLSSTDLTTFLSFLDEQSISES